MSMTSSCMIGEYVFLKILFYFLAFFAMNVLIVITKSTSGYAIIPLPLNCVWLIDDQSAQIVKILNIFLNRRLIAYIKGS